MTISSSTSSNCVTSCRFAPVTTSDNGTPRPSTNRCLLVPFFSPVGRVLTNCFQGQWCLDHCPVYTLPFPGDAFHLIVFSKAGAPESNKKAGFHPVHGYGVRSCFLMDCLAFLAQHSPQPHLPVAKTDTLVNASPHQAPSPRKSNANPRLTRARTPAHPWPPPAVLVPSPSFMVSRTCPPGLRDWRIRARVAARIAGFTFPWPADCFCFLRRGH